MLYSAQVNRQEAMKLTSGLKNPCEFFAFYQKKIST